MSNETCPSCKRDIETEVWGDGQCSYCGRYYTWEDVPTIVDDRYRNQVTIDRDELVRLRLTPQGDGEI